MAEPTTPGPKVPAADARLAEYGVLEEPAGRDLQALVELAADLAGTPNAAINLITATHQHQVATTGIDPSVCAREDSMCAAVLDETVTVIAPDASGDPRFAQNPFVNGTIDSVRFYASAPLVTPDGTVVGRLCVFDTVPRALDERQAEMLGVLAERVVDVLELRLRTRQLEQSLAELTRTRDELHRSNELLSLFAGQVSHDLRSPLTAIIASSELLVTDPTLHDHPDVIALAQGTLSAGQRMAALIDSILQFTRLGADLDLRDVQLDEVLDDVLADLSPGLQERDVDVVRRPLPVLRADREHLYAVLLNLVGNAVKFTPSGTRPVVEVCAERDGDAWMVRVADHGPGIDPKDRAALFELYRRGRHGLGGSGIGLATARRAIEAHGGRIGIDDTPGGGTTVWFTIPD